MDNMRISGGLGIFKKLAAPKSDNKISNNPFASNPFGLSFKGKLHTGDVFETSKPSLHSKAVGLKNEIVQRGRMAVSAAVGSLTHIQSTFKSACKETFGPIIVFAQKTGEQISKMADVVSNFKASDLRISNLKKAEEYPNASKQAKRLLQKHKDPMGLKALWLAHPDYVHA